MLYVQWAIALALNLVVVFWWAGSAQFAKRPIIDLALTLPILVWMEAIRIVMTTQSGITGWAPAATITANYTLGVAFASLFFPANVRSYIAWFVIHAILFAWALARTESPPIETSFGWGVYVPVALIGIYSSWAIDRKGRANFELAAAERGGISVTKQTYFATRDRVGYLPSRTVMLKGIGDTQIYDVKG